MRQNWLCLSTLVLLLSGCKAGVTVQDVEICAAAGSLRNGANCTHLISAGTRELTMTEYLDMLEPKLPVGVEPYRPGAFCMTSNDYGKMKTALEIACHLLGKRCKHEVVDEIRETGQKTFTKAEVEKLRKELNQK